MRAAPCYLAMACYDSGMEKLIDALLSDENGISEEAYNILYEYLEFVRDTRDRFTLADQRIAIECLSKLCLADATDGRFYFSN